MAGLYRNAPYWSVDPRAPYHFDFSPDQYAYMS